MTASASDYQFDALLVVQPVNSAPVTATTVAPNTLDLYRINTSPYNAVTGEHGIPSFDLVVYVAAADRTTGDESYKLQIASLDSNGVATLHDTVELPATATGKVTPFGISPRAMEALSGNASKLQVTAVLAGTTPSLQYWAFAAPHSAQ